MKRVTPKKIRDDNIEQAILGLILACIGVCIHLFFNNEASQFFSKVFVGYGTMSFISGVYRALNYKNIVRKIIEKANPNTEYEIPMNSEKITDELTSKILTESLMKMDDKNLVSPKRRKMEGILGLVFAIFIIFALIFMNLHEQQSIFMVSIFSGMSVFLLLYSFYLLKTLKKYRKNYFKVKYFAKPQAGDNSLLTDHTDEYWKTMEDQYDSGSMVPKILVALVILLIITIFIAYIR